ncbi:MAG TPA: homocysteine S-methyltransferase family protein [Phycisphaerae bacterium]|nr:homocysteine S-methyltransferase family protein [Phycisphaerae bacterium]HNU43852.1 homocysteine S-methyltransferase family protein [Phycisphaerae bacterium]
MTVDFNIYRQRPGVADGAWGTMLMACGSRPGELVELWNLTRPADVRAVAAAYVQAGAEIILTNTFRANRFALEHAGAGQQAFELNEAGARLSRAAAGTQVRVFGSLGPSGKMLIMKEVTPDALRDAFAEQARGLAAGGADAIVCETFFDLQELLIAVAAAQENTPLPVVASMTFDSGPDRTRTMMGVSPAQAVTALGDAGAAAVGCNCGLGIDGYIKVVQQMRTHTTLPIWAKPNAGLPETVQGKVVYHETPEAFAGRAPALAAAGANVIGGCCGTTPDFIRALASALRRHDD